MKYGYIPLEPIVSELQAQLKTMVKMGKFDTDDCYQYAVQCLRKIGCTEYEVNEEIIQLQKHRFTIPKHFYLFEDVRLANASTNFYPLNTTPTEVTKNEFLWNGNVFNLGKSLRPVDTVTTQFCNSKFFNHDCSSVGFSFKIPPGVLSCDLKDAHLYIKYHGLKQDECGNYMVQDEENGIEAIKGFIKTQVLEEDYLMQKIPRYIYQDIKRDFDIALSSAQAALLELGPAEVNDRVARDRRKFDKFKLK
jgi:hypothetical protein